MSRRAVLLLSAAALLGAALPAGAAPPAPKTLTGTFRVVATASAYVDVRLPQPVRFEYGSLLPRGASVTATGRVAGIMLLALDGSRYGLDLLRYNLCGAPGCASEYGWTYFHAHSPDERDPITLPAGAYRLLVVADGGKVDATLRLPGLSGSRTVRASGHLNVRHFTPEYDWATGTLPVETLFTGSAEGSFDGAKGIILDQFTVATDVSAHQSYAFCVFSGPVLGEPAPECPGGTGHQFDFVEVKTEKSRFRSIGVVRYLEQGTYRAGSYYRTLGAAHDPVGSITFVTLPRN